MWCVPELDDEYVENMEDVLETYEIPYNPAEPVICLDEKPITLHAEVRPPMPAEPGREARRDSEYKRCGTANGSSPSSQKPFGGCRRWLRWRAG